MATIARPRQTEARVAGAVDLSRFDGSCQEGYDPGRPALVRIAWFAIGSPLLRCSVLPSSSFRTRLLRWFGAEVGAGAVIKPGVRVKFPWKLKLGNHCWIGEDCWIDNLAEVRLGDHVCMSQGAYLCTGSHDWTDPCFRLITRPITIGKGAWIAARASLGPGTVVEEHAVVGLGSVVTGTVPAYEIHAGNPARFVRRREIAEHGTYCNRGERS